MMDEINRLNNEGLKSEVTNETKVVVESITGLDYDDLWKNDELL